jgi:methylated-DNA-[protein]-cysteine S-methyltransferase
VRWAALPTAIGDLGVAVDDAGVCAVRFAGPPAGHHGETPPQDPVLDAALNQLSEYFAGTRTGFALPLSVRGGSAFERAVWQALTTIPYGEMRTYGEIADLVGDGSAPDAARAVGVACNRNRLPVLLPCHRVVGAGGKLVGFGGGLARKRYLLELEARVCIERAFTFGDG